MRFRLEESLKTCNLKRAARKQKMGKSKITTYSCNMKRAGENERWGKNEDKQHTMESGSKGTCILIQRYCRYRTASP